MSEYLLLPYLLTMLEWIAGERHWSSAMPSFSCVIHGSFSLNFSLILLKKKQKNKAKQLVGNNQGNFLGFVIPTVG